jgi:hypothetical protein
MFNGKALDSTSAGEMSRQQKNATDPVAWRTVAQASERAARLWEAVARNIAGATPDGSAVLHRQMLAHGLMDPAAELTAEAQRLGMYTVPTDSEGAES